MGLIGGLIEIGLGLFLISPADELVTAGASFGFSLPSAPAQLVGTGAVGAILVIDGLRRLNK